MRSRKRLTTITVPQTRLLQELPCQSAETVKTVDALRRSAEKVAEDYGAVFVPLQDEFSRLAAENGDKYWIWDGVHPTEAGHCMMAHRVLDAAAGILGIGEGL